MARTRSPAGRQHRCVRLAGLTLLVLLTSGCASHGLNMQEVERHLAAGDPERALDSLARVSQAPRNRGLHELDRGMILRMQGDLQGSIEAFAAAREILGALEAISLTETAGALTISEQVTSYSGDIYERILLHVYQALNYLETGNPEAARVEALQIDLGLRRIDNRHGRAPYGGDAFARYLAGLVYEASGESSDAMISYRKAYEAYREYPGITRSGMRVPRDLLQRLARLARELGLADEAGRYRAELGDTPLPQTVPGQGEVVILVHNSLAPARVSESIATQDLESGQIYRVSLPVLRARGSRASGAVVHGNGYTANTEVVEDIERIARTSLDAQMPALTARAITRNVARHHAASAAREESELLGLFINIAGAVAEEADTRSWRTLPADIQLASLRLPAGTYDIEIELSGTSTARRSTLREVTVRAGEISFRSLHWVPGDISLRRRP